jgi:hypothetical protein
VRARELERAIEITIKTGLRANNIDKGKTPVNRFDKEVVFTLIIFKGAKIFSQSQRTGNLEYYIIHLTRESGNTSNEKLWNHLFISTMPPVASALRSTPTIKFSTYRFSVGSNFFKDAGLKEGFMTRRKNP